MPPKENDRLDDQQIAALQLWIESGAPWPDDETQSRIWRESLADDSNEDGVRVTTSGGTSDDWTNRRYQEQDLWAFQPLTRLTEEELQQYAVSPRSTVEENDNSASTSDEVRVDASRVVDGMIDRRLGSAGLTAAPRADARTLIRRATFDLHGLPPTPEEVAEFEAAAATNHRTAWEALIERLLSSPRYGERWARHWLDVTRYADTGGMSNDYERSNMWRYRDYVIRAFNDDKPYDAFIVEQLAGDELADESVRTRKGAAHVAQTRLDGDYTEQESEWIVATGFLRLGPWDNAMVAAEEARQIWLDDLVNITGQTFLSTTMRCVKCHDHKFDPIPTRDYYRIYAAFSTTHMAERAAPFLASESREGFEAGRRHVQRMLDFAVAEKDRLVAKREAAARAWYDAHDLPYQDLATRKDLPDDQKPPRHVGLNHVEQGQLKVREQDEWIWKRRLERYRPMAQSIYNAAASDLAWNGARKLRIDPNETATEPPTSHILIGGALAAMGDRVIPGVLSALLLPVNATAPDPFAVTDDVNGRRLELAQWIADPDNGLATRSIVNRIWQYHFGRGIAANPNNFGAKGAKPSHPDVLEFLAANFVDHGWKMKRLHRLIMMTEAYQRSSVPADEQWEVADPNNQLQSFFARRRLSAEEIRDGTLLITDELVDRNGGVPVSPEINMEVALQPRMIQFSLAPAYQPSRTPEERNARTVYAYHVRGQADPFTEIFNQPNPNESCERRESAAVTPQVFTLLNSDVMTDRSIAFAMRIQRDAATPELQIQHAFQLALNRDASPEEIARLTDYFEKMTAYHSDTEPAPTTYPTEIVRSLVEEFSGKPFEYREILPVFEDYVADVKAVDVTPQTRAMADVCLLLLNTNEFIYLN